MTAKTLRATIERLRARIYEMDDELSRVRQELRGQIELNQALQDRLDQTRAEALGVLKEDAHDGTG